MIAVYNMLRRKYGIDYSGFFTFSTTTHTRGHNICLNHFQQLMPGDIFH